MSFLKNKKNGATLVEAAFAIPLLVSIIFCILEVYRLKVAEKLTENVAMHVSTEFSYSTTISADRIRSIIKECHAESDMRFFENDAIDDNLRCSITVYTKHEDAKNSVIQEWPMNQGETTLISGDTQNEQNKKTSTIKGDTVVTVAFLKYKFLTNLTKAIFTGQTITKGNDDFMLIRKTKFTKHN